MCAIPQLVSAPLNPIPIAEHFRRSHPQCEHKTEFKAECRKWLEVDRRGKCFLNMGQDRAIHFHYVIFHSLVFIVKFLVIVNPNNLLLLCCNDVLY